MGGRINGNRKKKESIKQKWLGSMFCIGSLLLFVSVSGFRMEEEAVETMFDTSSEYMVLSLLENEMEVLRREEKNIDVSRLPEYVTRYPELYAPEINSGGEEKDASGSLSSDNEQGVAKKIAYLTFDDGPSEQTATVLDILKEEGIHATFFLVGEEITAETEEIVKRMVEEGHTVGLHTYSHDYEFIYRSVDNFLSDYEKL